MAVKDLWNKKARDISYAWFMIRFSSAKLVFSSAKENKKTSRCRIYKLVIERQRPQIQREE